MITFESPAFAGVMMFDAVAKHMMELIGKEPADMGVVTVEDLPAAIAKLKVAIGADSGGEIGAAANDSGEPGVSVTQRALPLIDLFEWSLKRKVPVVWGV